MDHTFWNTQPIPHQAIQGDIVNEPIEVKELSSVRTEPYPLPGFEWCELDLTNDAVIDEVYNLLERHYVEDDSGSFRFKYSKEFLRWAMCPPGFHPEWLVGVRAATGKKALFGMITAVPTHMAVRGSPVMMADVNFLCVHQKLRARRLAPVLIREITRRVNLKNIWQAVYTAGKLLPTPVASCPYWHRSINIKKLIECKFTGMPRNATIARMQRVYTPPAVETLTLGMRKMQKSDVGAVTVGLNKYLSQFKLSPIFTEEEVEHWLLPRDGVVSSFVSVENNEVTNFTSFYSLPSSVLNNMQHDTIMAAYHFYSFCTHSDKSKVLAETISLAHSENYDVFNLVQMMDNDEKMLRDNKFGPGDGNLHFYLYNWKTNPMEVKDIGFTML